MSIFPHRDPSKEMILAQGITHRLSLKSPLNNNVLLVGAAGRGKTRQHIKANIMQMNSNFVVADPGGRLVQELGLMLQKDGYSVQVLNFADMTNSEHYNPMYYLYRESDVLTLIDYLMDSINDQREGKDPFWDNSARVLLSSIVYYLMEEDVLADDRHLHNVWKLLDCHKVSEDYDDSPLDVMMKDLELRKPDNLASKQYHLFKNAAGSQTTEASILLTALVYMQHFTLPEYQDLTSQNTLDLDALLGKRSALFIVTSETDRSKDWLCDLFFSQLINVLCSRPHILPIHFFLDGFTTYKITDFDRKFSAFRRNLLSATIVLQDEAQLERAYGAAAARSIISNCDHYVFMGSDNMDLCEKVAQRTGKKAITGAKLRRLSHDKCVVISGRKSGIYRKYRLEKHPHYKEIVDEALFPASYGPHPNCYNIHDHLVAKKWETPNHTPQFRKQPDPPKMVMRRRTARELEKVLPLSEDIPGSETTLTPEEKQAAWSDYNAAQKEFEETLEGQHYDDIKPSQEEKQAAWAGYKAAQKEFEETLEGLEMMEVPEHYGDIEPSQEEE